MEPKPVKGVSLVGIEPTTHGLKVRQQPVPSRVTAMPRLTRRVVHFCQATLWVHPRCRLGASSTSRCQTVRLQSVSNLVLPPQPLPPGSEDQIGPIDGA